MTVICRTAHSPWGPDPPSAPASSRTETQDHHIDTTNTITTTERNIDMTYEIAERCDRAGWTILKNACDGRLMEGPWTRHEDGVEHFDSLAATTRSNTLSTSDQMVLRCAASLLDAESALVFRDELTLMESEDLRVVLDALRLLLDDPSAAPSAAAAGGIDS